MSAALLHGTEAAAVELVARGKVGEQFIGAKAFPVQSSSGDRTYLVTLAGELASCTCPAHSPRCKHIIAAELRARLDQTATGV